MYINTVFTLDISHINLSFVFIWDYRIIHTQTNVYGNVGGDDFR